MRKYTSPTETANKLAKIYNKTPEEIYNLRKQHDCMLTVEELKIKYNNPNMEQLPDWITEPELQELITKCINSFCKKYKDWFDKYLDKEDVFIELYLFARKKIHTWKNKAMACTSLKNQLHSIIYFAGRNDNMFHIKLEQKVNTTEEDEGTELIQFIPSVDECSEERMFLSNIQSIKDEELRNLLIVTGYLIANISCLHNMYLDLLNTSPEQIKQNIELLEQKLMRNEKILNTRIETGEIIGKRKNLSVQDVVKALELNKQEVFIDEDATKLKKKIIPVKDYILGVQEYLKDMKLFG